MAAFPVLETPRLLLRQIGKPDLVHVFAALSDPRVTEFYGVHFESLESTRSQMRWYANLETNGTGIWWAVCSKDDDFCGAAGLSDLHPEHRKAELGFWLLPPHWGQGLMAEALPAVINYGFNAMHLHRLEAFVETGNANAKKLLLKCLFQHEGTMRDCEIKNGKFISLELFARLRTQE